MTGKLRAIIKRPDEEYGHVTNISATLRNLQITVEGFIETLTLQTNWNDPDAGKTFVLIMDEEGLWNKKEENCVIQGFRLLGTIVVLGKDGDEFADCPLTFDEWKKMLRGDGT